MSKTNELNLATEFEEPTEAELLAAGIDLEVWEDPECWDDQERAFHWQWTERKNAAADLARRTTLAERFKLPASWDFLLPFVERLCGQVHQLDQAACRVFTDWDQKIIFANVKLSNCEIAVELNTLAKVAVGDILVSRTGDKVYRVVHAENCNDRNYFFGMPV